MAAVALLYVIKKTEMNYNTIHYHTQPKKGFRATIIPSDFYFEKKKLSPRHMFYHYKVSI